MNGRIAIVAAICSFLFVAQSPITSFPPGSFQNRAALSSGAASPPAYAFRNSCTFSGSGDIVTCSIDIGTASADRLVVVGVGLQNSPTIVSVTANAVGLASVVAQGASNWATIYAGLVTTGSGAQNIVLTTSGGTFVTRDMFVWTATGLGSNTAKQTAGWVGNNGVISVAANDFMFSIARGTVGNYSASTQAPTNFHSVVGTSIAADWIITSTNASFSVKNGSSVNAVAATYQ